MYIFDEISIHIGLSFYYRNSFALIFKNSNILIALLSIRHFRDDLWGDRPWEQENIGVGDKRILWSIFYRAAARMTILGGQRDHVTL